MKKYILFAVAAGLIQLNFASAEQCTYTPNKAGFSFSFTAYGAPDKSYKVSKNTFKSFELKPNGEKLVGSAIIIDATTVDTSNDLNNGGGGEWPASLMAMRNSNVVNGLFKNFADPGKIYATVKSIEGSKLSLEVKMNEVTKDVVMDISEADGKLMAKGTLDILADFKGEKAFKAFEALCTAAWHKGKTWSDIDIEFSVPVTKACS